MIVLPKGLLRQEISIDFASSLSLLHQLVQSSQTSQFLDVLLTIPEEKLDDEIKVMTWLKQKFRDSNVTEKTRLFQITDNTTLRFAWIQTLSDDEAVDLLEDKSQEESFLMLSMCTQHVREAVLKKKSESCQEGFRED